MGGTISVSEQDDSDPDRRFEEQEKYFRESVQPAISRAASAYEQNLTRLWAANGAASLASLSFVGGAWHQNQLTQAMLVPLGFFLTGLLSMGLGAILSLHRETEIARQLERATSLLQSPADKNRSPSQTAGLTFSDWRTSTAYVAAACFGIGLIVGFIELCCNVSIAGSG